MSLKDFKTIESNLSTTEFNGIVSLYKHFKKHYESFRITDTVVGDYADYVFDIADTTVLDNGIVITDETITAEPKVKLTNPVFHYSTYVLKLDVLHYSGVNIFDDETPLDLKVIDTLEIELVDGEWVDIPVTGLEQGYIISFDSNIEITHDQTEIHGITGLAVNSNPNPIMKTETTDITGQLLDYNGEPYNLSDAGGKTIHFYEKLTLNYTFSATKNPIQSGETTDIKVKAKDEDGSILIGEKIYFYEKYEPSINIKATNDIIETDETTDFTAYVKDASDGSRIPESNVKIYFYEEAQHLVDDITLTVSESSLQYKSLLVLTASVVDENDDPISHRTVKFYDNDVLLGKSISGSDGLAVLQLSNLSVGSHSVSAFSDGVTSSSVSVTVVKASPTLSLSGSNITYGSNVNLTGTLSVGGGESVKIYQSSTVIDTVVTSGTGSFTKSVSGLNAGSYSFKAGYEATDNYNSAESSTVNITVSKATPSVSLTGSSATIKYGQSVTLNGVCSAGSGVSVKIYQGNTLIDTVTSGTGGKFSKVVSGLNAGSYSFKAVFEGNSNYNSGESSSVIVTVNKLTPTLIWIYGSGATYPNNVEISGALSNTGAGKSVKIYRGNTLVGTVTTGYGGIFTKTLSGLNAGTYVFKAVYEGDSNFNSVTSSNLTVNVNRASASITLSGEYDCSTNVYSRVDLTGTLSVGSGESVKIYMDNTLVGTVTTGSGGVFNKRVNSVSKGNHIFKAVYDSNSNYKEVSSPNVSIDAKHRADMRLNIVSGTGNRRIYATVSINQAVVVKFYVDGDLYTTATTQYPPDDRTPFIDLNDVSEGTHTIKAVYEGDSEYCCVSDTKEVNITN